MNIFLKIIISEELSDRVLDEYLGHYNRLMDTAPDGEVITIDLDEAYRRSFVQGKDQELVADLAALLNDGKLFYDSINN